ncbi:MAG: hypothetical protein HQ559_06525, partial [Lentisphaerae bacterium]|nr:hypothetical protein [Lentisphaerota bacterium]
MKTNHCYLYPALAVILGLTCLTARADVKLTGNIVETPKHVITLDKTGLPAQLVIKADMAELPLSLRSVKPTDKDLQAIGRGPQLSSPVRLQAVIGGQTIVAQPAEPA